MKKVLYRHHEVIYSHYHGDTTNAIVEHGRCIRSVVVGQTGATFRWNNTDPNFDPWKNATVEELKAAGFTYSHTRDVLRNAEGQSYIEVDGEPGVYYNEDGGFLPERYERLTADEVVILDAQPPQA